MVEKVEALRFSERRLRVTTPRSAPGSFGAGRRSEIRGLCTQPDRRRKETHLWRICRAEFLYFVCILLLNLRLNENEVSIGKASR